MQAASVSLHGPHGQHIENIHLQPYESDEHFFDVLYKQHYSKIFQKAEDFVQGIGGIDDDVLVFIRSVQPTCVSWFIYAEFQGISDNQILKQLWI